MQRRRESLPSAQCLQSHCPQIQALNGHSQKPSSTGIKSSGGSTSPLCCFPSGLQANGCWSRCRGAWFLLCPEATLPTLDLVIENKDNTIKWYKGQEGGTETETLPTPAAHWVILPRMEFISHEWTWNSSWPDFEKLPICFVFKIGFSFVEKFQIRDYVNPRDGSVPKGKIIPMGFLRECIEVRYLIQNLFP